MYKMNTNGRDPKPELRLLLPQIESVTCLECCKFYTSPATASCGQTLCRHCWYGRRLCPTCAGVVNKKALKLNQPLERRTKRIHALANAFEKCYQVKIAEMQNELIEIDRESCKYANKSSNSKSLRLAMKLVQSPDEIPELRKSNVHIKNEKDLIQKVNKIIKDGHKKLQIVTDFDHTLTRHTMDDGSMVLTSFGMFRECPSIPQNYKDEDVRLWALYKPIEDDPNMTIKEKTQHMIEWYIASNNMLKDVTLPRNELTEVGKTMVNCFRKGVKDMITWSQTHQVPVLVFSAGLGESVVAAMKAANFLLPHVKVVSNFLDTDSQDKITGIKGEVIHCYNKNETVIKHTEYYEMVKDRSNVILMGDNIGDAGMAEGMEQCDVVIKVGFLGDNVEGNLKHYLNIFDIVLVCEPSVDVVNAILKLVL